MTDLTAIFDAMSQRELMEAYLDLAKRLSVVVPGPCPASTTGVLAGDVYLCDLRAGHAGQHEATPSVISGGQALRVPMRWGEVTSLEVELVRSGHAIAAAVQRVEAGRQGKRITTSDHCPHGRLADFGCGVCVLTVDRCGAEREFCGTTFRCARERGHLDGHGQREDNHWVTWYDSEPGVDRPERLDRCTLVSGCTQGAAHPGPHMKGCVRLCSRLGLSACGSKVRCPLSEQHEGSCDWRAPQPEDAEPTATFLGKPCGDQCPDSPGVTCHIHGEHVTGWHRGTDDGEERRWRVRPAAAVPSSGGQQADATQDSAHGGPRASGA